MKPGRELDALVAEKVMGWTREYASLYDEEGVEGTRFYVFGGGWDEDECVIGQDDETDYEALEKIPRYSTDIAAAWEVVEKMRSKDTKAFSFRLAYCGPGWTTSDDQWKVEVSLIYGQNPDQIEIPYTEVSANTVPHAICLAALEATGENVADK